MNIGTGLPLQVQPPAAPNNNQLNHPINTYVAASYGNGGGSNAVVAGGGGASDGGECAVREQDRFMPIANVVRIMRKILPAQAKISDDSKETIQECVSEFISFVTGEANERCLREQRKTITAEDVLWAMSKLGFDDYIEPLTLYLHRLREFDAAAAAPAGFFTPPPPPADVNATGEGPSSSSSQSVVVAMDNGEEDHQEVGHRNKE
ncbi:OLC1v1005295C1 [Oldenlandia corymbosa var. corymbosa]|uniref:OLC1v1005295C1 n=1 Tax=Oldenlandia corymbosa var. corymbosa TaxID=529605 RepID=A0AAV1DH83_OLDCO|nr:OLC1v1005295C1 [Oldenlandia corymbosa var. corymbosa]